MSFKALKRFFESVVSSGESADKAKPWASATPDITMSNVEYAFTDKDGQPIPTTIITESSETDAKDSSEKVRLPDELCNNPRLTRSLCGYCRTILKSTHQGE